MKNVSVSPFGVVVEVIIDEVSYYVVIVNDFEEFKTFGNYDLDTRPFLVLDVSMNLIPENEENESLFNQLDEIIQKMVVDEQENMD